MKKFSIKKGNLELRSCDQHLANFNKHDRAEIVKWDDKYDGKEYCYTIGHWRRPKDNDFDFVFVGDRVLEVDESVIKLIHKGQRKLKKALAKEVL